MAENYAPRQNRCRHFIRATINVHLALRYIEPPQLIYVALTRTLLAKPIVPVTQNIHLVGTKMFKNVM